MDLTTESIPLRRKALQPGPTSRGGVRPTPALATNKNTVPLDSTRFRSYNPATHDNGAP